MEPLMRIELTTSSLPRKCSTPELQRREIFGVSLAVWLATDSEGSVNLRQSTPKPVSG